AAVSCNHVAKVRELVSQKVDVDEVAHNGNTPLSMAVEYGSVDVVEILLRHQAMVSNPDGDGNTPLHIAIRSFRDHRMYNEGVVQCYSICLLLLRYGADVKAVTNQGATPLHFAALTSLTAIVSLLLSYNSDVSARDLKGCTPLMYHVRRTFDWVDRKTDMIHLLVMHGAELRATDHNAMTTLHWAVHGNSCEKIRCLIHAGADEDATN
ncbi:ankyrin repeat-containing domain protein, partial [Baffinella frigidus]